MKREIKFRLRDENNKIVGYEKWYRGQFNKESEKDYWCATPDWLYSHDCKYWDPEPIKHRDKDKFTGLLDRDGKEIYEGDIHGNGFVVEYVSGMAGFYLMKNKEGFHLSHEQHVLDGRIKDIKIIGNIYENHELLKN